MNNLVRFTRVFSQTAKYVNLAKQVEKQKGALPLADLHPLMQAWASVTLNNLSLKVMQTGASVASEPVLFVGNHLSYLDIPLLLSLYPVAFVAKSELGKWPFFGAACRVTGTVLVKRESRHSRKEAWHAIAETCKVKKQSICIFPSGTTSLNEAEKPWKRGAFEIAQEHGLKIQAFRLNYQPREVSAFIGKDAFVPHLWRLLKEPEIKATIELSEPVHVNSVKEDCAYWQNWAVSDFPNANRPL